MTKRLNELLTESFTLTRKDIGAYSSVKAGIVRFHISQYEIENVGNLCIMQAKGPLGLMKMDTVILTPWYKDAPLYSYDRIIVLGKDTMLTEFYNTMLAENGGIHRRALQEIKMQYAEFPDYDTGTHWYDGLKLPESAAKRGKNISDALDSFGCALLAEYVRWLKAAPEADAQKKKEKTNLYCNGLLQNGGPSTDAFLKALGQDKTAFLFHRILFAAE